MLFLAYLIGFSLFAYAIYLEIKNYKFRKDLMDKINSKEVEK